MSVKNKIIAITPFVSLFIFFILGLFFDKWHPGWVVLLLIPIMPYLVGRKKISITFVAIVIYVTLGLAFNLWDKAWIVIFLVPIFHILIFPNKHKYIDD